MIGLKLSKVMHSSQPLRTGDNKLRPTSLKLEHRKNRLKTTKGLKCTVVEIKSDYVEKSMLGTQNLKTKGKRLKQ